MPKKKRDKKGMEKGMENSKSQVRFNSFKHCFKELWKFYKTGSCKKGDDCPYSHNLNLHPCKFIHATGTCKNGDKCEFSHNRLDHHEILLFIEENEKFLDQIFKECGSTNLGQYYSQFKIDKEKRQKEQHRKEIEEKMKHTLLPDEMKRDLINKKVEARFPSKSPSEGHNLSQNSLNERQVFENLDGVPRMAINNQPQNVDFMIMRNENMNRNQQMLSQLPNQMQREIQGK